MSPVRSAESIARARITRARAYHALGRQREAIVDLEFAERHFRDNNNPRQLARVYEVLADARAATGDWRRAYEASVANRKAQQELDRRAREEQTSRLRVQFDTARKEQENRALLIENAHRGEALAETARIEKRRLDRRAPVEIDVTVDAMPVIRRAVAAGDHRGDDHRRAGNPYGGRYTHRRHLRSRPAAESYSICHPENGIRSIGSPSFDATEPATTQLAGHESWQRSSSDGQAAERCDAARSPSGAPSSKDSPRTPSTQASGGSRPVTRL